MWQNAFCNPLCRFACSNANFKGWFCFGQVRLAQICKSKFAIHCGSVACLSSHWTLFLLFRVWRAGLCSHTVITMPASKSALEALATMREHDISGIAVVDEAGRLLGNFSMSELRTIRVEHFGALALPVAEFLALSHGADYSSGTCP
jgi:hypothetical protein